MTRKLILTTIAAFLMAANAMAQDVYYEVRAKALASVEAPGTPDLVRQIGQFKVDALDYMMLKMREQMPDSSTVFLDRQALGLNAFIGQFIEAIIDCTNKTEHDQVEMMKTFMDASFSNPLFNDTDTELAHSYYSNAACVTRFSLDTDWPRAAAAIESLRKPQDK